MSKITKKCGQPWTFSSFGSSLGSYSLWCCLSEGNELLILSSKNIKNLIVLKGNILLTTTSCLQAVFVPNMNVFYLLSDSKSLLDLIFPPCLELQITNFWWDLIDEMVTQRSMVLITFGSPHSHSIQTFINKEMTKVDFLEMPEFAFRHFCVGAWKA